MILSVTIADAKVLITLVSHVLTDNLCLEFVLSVWTKLALGHERGTFTIVDWAEIV